VPEVNKIIGRGALVQPEKIFSYGEKAEGIIKSRVPEESEFPKVVLIDTISFCNLKCSMCSHRNMKRKAGIMNWELYRKIIDEIAENEPNAQIWITFFGEGMILKDLPERIEYAVGKGVTNICLNSNGALFREEFAERLIRAGLRRLLVGIDSINEETYKQIRVGGDYTRTVNGVLRYKEMLDIFGEPGQDICVQFVEMDINSKEIDEFVAFWNSHNIKCKVRPMVSWGNKVNASNLVETEERLPCYWMMNTMSVIDTGIVPLCTSDLDSEYPQGDINVRTMKDVWNKELKTVRLMHREGRWSELPEMCRGCSDWQSGYAKYI
jgi:sulfatase maturation enzyme AslB (radical SAM superfamily)